MVFEIRATLNLTLYQIWTDTFHNHDTVSQIQIQNQNHLFDNIQTSIIQINETK